MLNYTFLYEETFDRCKLDSLCSYLTRKDLAFILNDIFNFTAALETHHQGLGTGEGAVHALAAKEFSLELLALLNHGQQNKIRYMYFCDQLGPKIALLTHGSEDDYINLFTKSRIEEHYCQHAIAIYRDMYEVTKDQEMRVVIYDEAEVFAVDNADPSYDYPFKERKTYIGPAMHFRARKPIVG